MIGCRSVIGFLSLLLSFALVSFSPTHAYRCGGALRIVVWPFAAATLFCCYTFSNRSQNRKAFWEKQEAPHTGDSANQGSDTACEPSAVSRRCYRLTCNAYTTSCAHLDIGARHRMQGSSSSYGILYIFSSLVPREVGSPHDSRPKSQPTSPRTSLGVYPISVSSPVSRHAVRARQYAVVLPY